MKAIYIVCVIALLGAMMVAPAAATTWDVYEGDSIQDALNAASDGDTVFVHAGTYPLTGILWMGTPNLTLKGEGADVVTLEGDGSSIAIGNGAFPSQSAASGCVVEGFRIRNKPVSLDDSSHDCVIRNNVFEDMDGMAINLYGPNSYNTTIVGNVMDMVGNNNYAIYSQVPITFVDNIVSNVTGQYCAVYIRASDSIIVNNTIVNSKCSASSSRALTIRDASNCTVTGNTITNNNGDGIRIWGTSAANNTIKGNNISSNTRCGICLRDAGESNEIYLNDITGNPISVMYIDVPPTTIYWNSTEPIEYTYNGTTYMDYLGNYWSDYSGVDTSPEDGIGDTLYGIPGSATDNDHRPLMEPFENYLGEGAADPDLTPTSIATDSLSAGVPAAITVDVSNIGSAEAGSFNVSLKVEDTVIGSDTVASLNAGSSVPVLFTWTPDAAGTFNLTTIVDSDDAVAESDEANNGLTREVTVEEQSTPTPSTSFLISGSITYDNGNPVMNPAVTVTNLATSEDFTVKTDASSNYYLTLTDSTHITAGDTIRIIASDGSASSETDHPVTASKIETGGFVQDMTIESGELPDLTVTEMSEEWISLADATYNVTCTVANIGTSGADASTTTIEVDGNEVANDSVPALAIGESHTSTLGPFTLSGENDTIRVCADIDDNISELNETNNCLENVLEAPSMPDLIVWVALKTSGYVNEDNILGVRVKNTGTEDAGSFSVSLAIDGTPMPEQTVPSLAGGETTELEYAWIPTELGGHALSATVDTNNDVEESDETNNDFTRTSVIIKHTDWAQFHYDEVHTGFSPSGAPNTNETLWISDEISAIGGTSTVVADGMVFAYGGPTGWGGEDGVLYCLDEFTGAILWNIGIPTPAYGSWSSPAYHNGRVFTSTGIEAGCYNAATGEQIWTFENPTNEPGVNGGPVVADGKVIVNDWQAGHYYCLDEETGELLWTFTEEQTGGWGVGYAQGVPAYEDEKFYLTTWLYTGGNVYCVDADTGTEIWNKTFSLDTCGSPVVVEGTVYVSTYDFYGTGEIYALNAGNGDVLWQRTIQRSDSTPAVAYGNVYVTGGCKDYSSLQTYCFNAITGDLVWSTDAADEIGEFKISVAVADGKVFVGKAATFFEYAGTVALDAFTGDEVWSYPQGGSSPAIADDMVFTIGGGRVYAFCDPLPDLTVAAIATPANLQNDVINPISATIENIGGSAAENFIVLLEVDGDQVDTATIATLAAGENTTVEFLWTPDATGGATLTVIADAGNSVEELDETNNELTKDVEVILPAGVTFDRKKLDLNSNGILKAFITLPVGYDVADINVSTVECEGAHVFGDGSVIPGKQALEVKFKIPDMVDVPTGDAVLLSVTGELTTGEIFEGSNTVKVTAK